METCLGRSTHNRTEEELRAIAEVWEPCPKEQLRLNVQPLIEWNAIRDLPMEDISNDEMDEDELEEKVSKNASVTLSGEKGNEEALEVVEGNTINENDETEVKDSKETEVGQQEKGSVQEVTSGKVSEGIGKEEEGVNESVADGEKGKVSESAGVIVGDGDKTVEVSEGANTEVVVDQKELSGASEIGGGEKNVDENQKEENSGENKEEAKVSFLQFIIRLNCI